MRKVFFISMFIVLAAALLSACGGASTSASSDDGSSSQPVNIAVSTNPSPAIMGDVELALMITDGDGNPIEGATVDVSADHTDMTGMGMSGLATEQGGGRYSINANFTHTGNWMLTIYVRKEKLEYKEDIEFKVQ